MACRHVRSFGVLNAEAGRHRLLVSLLGCGFDRFEMLSPGNLEQASSLLTYRLLHIALRRAAYFHLSARPRSFSGAQPMVRKGWTVAFLIAVCVMLTIAMAAQVETGTTIQTGAPTQQVQVDRAEVVYVAGNDLVIRMDNGQIEHVVVPNGVTVTVEGKELNVHDLKPGMRLQQT